MKGLFLRAAAVALALCIIPSAAKAAWLTSGSTLTTPIPGATADDSATVYYAVYDNSNHDFVANSGLNFQTWPNSGALATLNNDNFVYIYQVANPLHTPIDDLYLANPQKFDAVVSANGYTFNDSSNNAVKTSGQTLANNATLSDNFKFVGSETTPGSKTLATDIVGASMNGFHPFGNPAAERVAFGYTDAVFGRTANPIAVGGFGSLVIGGSNEGPSMGMIQTGDGSAASSLAPVPTPEPGTLALIGLGLPILGWGYARRLRASKAVAAQ